MRRIAAVAEWEWHYRIALLFGLSIEYQFQVGVKRFDGMIYLAGPSIQINGLTNLFGGNDCAAKSCQSEA